MASPLSSIVIAGGGTAGWGFAGLLARALGPSGPAIRVIDTDDAPQEDALSTLPVIRELHARLGISDAEAVRRCAGGFKLGERFEGASGDGTDSFLPFGAIGADIGPVRFHQQLARLAEAGPTAPFAGYALAAAAARQNRFAPPARDPRSIMSTLDYGLHLNASAHADLLAATARSLGVEAIEGRIGQAGRDERGRIAHVALDDGRRIEADFWIDATPDGMLADTPWQAWAEDTPFDRIATARMPLQEAPPTFTTNTARPSGWRRDIPLRGSLVRRFTCSAAMTGEDAARAELGGAEDVVFADFATGWRPQAWQGNCLTTGPAACRPDPLAAAEIALLVSAAGRFAHLLPHAGHGETEAREYNRLFAREVADVRDFALAFHHAQSRPEPVWQACRAAAPTDTLAHILALFESRGRTPRSEGRIHDETRWTAALLALGLEPRRHDPQADALGLRALTGRTDRIRDMVNSAVAAMPGHADTLARICAGDTRP